MSYFINKILNPLKTIVNNVNKFSTTSIALKAMSCVHVPTEGEPRKLKWYPYPVHDSRRLYFPRAHERKRIITHGFDKRMSTAGGKAVLMKRILKGRHVLSH